MRRLFTVLALGWWLSLFIVSRAVADPVDPTTLHYVCTGSTVCSAGATTLVTGSTLPTFDITVQGATGVSTGVATLYIIALTPSSTSLSFSINSFAATNASSTLGLYDATDGPLYDGGNAFFPATHFATANPNFSAYASASGQAGITPTGFTVYFVPFDLTGVPAIATGGGVTLLSAGSGGITGISSFPVGTVFIGAMSEGSGGSLLSSSTTVINTTPLSEGVTVVPEPTSLLLLGSGLAGLGLLGRKFKGRMRA